MRQLSRSFALAVSVIWSTVAAAQASPVKVCDGQVNSRCGGVEKLSDGGYAVDVVIAAGSSGGSGSSDGIIRDGNGAGQADVIGSAPAGTEQGLVVRPIPSGTQPVSGPLTDTQLRASAVPVSLSSIDVTDRSARLLGHTTIDNASLAVTGTFWPTTAAAPSSIEISDGAAFYVAAKTGQFPSALVGGRLDINLGAWLGSTAPTVGQKAMASSVPVAIASDQSAVPVSGTVTANQGTAAAASGAWPAKLTDGTNTAAVKAASTAALAADPAVVASLSPNSPLPTGSNTIGALTANQSVNVAQVAGSATSTAATGVQKVGVVGNAGAAVDAANNAAAPANVLAQGWETVASGTQPAAATGGNVRRPMAGLDGVPFARLGGPVTWTCGLSALVATATSCKAAPGAGLKLYVTDVLVNTTTTTAGTWNLQSAPTTCGTSATAVLPAANTTDKYTAPISTAQPQFLPFTTPIALAANTPLCVIGTTTNTINITISGYTAP